MTAWESQENSWEAVEIIYSSKTGQMETIAVKKVQLREFSTGTNKSLVVKYFQMKKMKVNFELYRCLMACQAYPLVLVSKHKAILGLGFLEQNVLSAYFINT